jgi:hypothetical protein
MKPKDIPYCDQAWRDGSIKTVDNLEQVPKRKKISKDSYQALWRAVGDNQRKKLCLVLMKAFEKEFHGSLLSAWRSKYSIEYPD